MGLSFCSKPMALAGRLEGKIVLVPGFSTGLFNFK